MIRRNSNVARKVVPLEEVERTLASGFDYLHFVQDLPQAAPVAFQQRCRERAATSAAVVRLREARRLVGFRGLPIGDYLSLLAESARHPLAPVLASFSIGNLSLPNLDDAGGIASLAVAIGVPWRELRVYAGLALAGGQLPGRARFAGRQPEAVGDWEAALSDWLEDVDASSEQRFRAFEARLRAEFRRAADKVR